MDALSMMKHGYHLHIRLSPAAEQCKGSAGENPKIDECEQCEPHFY